MKTRFNLAGRLPNLPPRLMMLLSFAGNSLTNYVFGLVLSWLLLPGDFGLLAFAQTILLIGGLILNSGFAWSTTAEIARAKGSQAERLVRGSFVANLSLALAMSTVILLLFAWGPLRAGLENWEVALSVAATLPFISIIAIASGSVRGAERFGELALIRFLEVGFKAFAGIIMVLVGFGATGAVAGFLIGSVVAAIVGIWRTMRKLKMSLFGGIVWPSMRTAWGMFGALLGIALLLNLDIIAMKLFAGSERELAGYYQAAIILANTPYYMATAMLAVLFPQLSRLGKLSLTGESVAETVRLLLIFMLPIEIVLALAPEAALSIVFPDAYVAGASALRILALGNASIIFVATLSVAFQATGKARIPSIILLATTFFEAIGLFFAVPLWRATGAASLFLVASFSSLIALTTLYLRQIEWRMTKASATWFAKYALTLSLGIVAMLAFHKASHNVLISVMITGLLYLASVLYLRLVRLPDFIMKRIHGIRKSQAVAKIASKAE
jgi:O-antigen/teichoic acid export membrane protein